MAKEEVRDGYLGDLPEDIRTKIMAIHKIIVDGANSEFKKPKYNDINKQAWAKTMLDEFLTVPTDKSHVGSVRVYKKGKIYKCMIQCTGHVTNNRNTEDEELFHGFIRNLHTGIRGKIRRQFDVTLSCESEHGEPFEGFDIWLKKDTAKIVWEKFSDKTVKEVKHMDESASVLIAEISDLPIHLQSLIEDVSMDLTLFNYNEDDSILSESIDNTNETGYTVIQRNRDGSYNGSIIVSPEFTTESIESSTIFDEISEAFSEEEPTKNLVLQEEGYFIMELTSEYSEKLWKYIEENTEYIAEKLTEMEYHIKRFREKYHYNPADKTIIVDGEKYWVDDDINNPVFMNKNKLKLPVEFRIPEKRRTCTYQWSYDTDEIRPVIVLDKFFFKLPGERADTVLYHEIAHTKQPRTRSGGIGLIGKDSEQIFQKYDRGDHAVPEEFEADRYAANRTSAAATKKAVRQLYHMIPHDDTAVRREVLSKYSRQMRSEEFKKLPAEKQAELMARFTKVAKQLTAPETIAQARAAHNRGSQVDMIQRGKALKDKTTSKIPELKPGYKGESIDDEIVFDPYTESEDYNVDMSANEAKRTLKTLSQSIINKPEITQYTANIYANVITKNLLSSWAKGYNKLSITLDFKSSGIFEFKTSTIANDFVARFIEGRESLNGFLHRTPEIKIRMSPDIFTKMKNPDDAYNFFRAAVRYYDAGVNVYSSKLMNEVMKLNSDMKRLISTSKLSGIVSCPLKMLFTFDNVDISNKNIFKISLGDINTINQFVKNIYSRYAAPEKEKKKIIDDLNDMIKSMRSSNADQDTIKEMTEFRTALQSLYEGGFDKDLATFKDQFIQENIDTTWATKHPDPQVKYLIEKTKVKKLKKIPADLVAYITIEAESIRDATDKHMIASYCIGKIEIVEWYIELLEVGSNKYIVPHTKPYLESVRTQLLACYKKIMATPIPNPATKPLIDIQYPKGYEG